MRRPGLAHAARLLLAALAGCSPEPLPDGVPALIVEPDATSREELRQIVQTALDGASVTLAPDALTTDSVLSVEHGAPRGLDAPPATGRQLGRPETFRLLLDGPQCVLVHERTGLRWLLLETTCVAQ